MAKKIKYDAQALLALSDVDPKNEFACLVFFAVVVIKKRANSSPNATWYPYSYPQNKSAVKWNWIHNKTKVNIHTYSLENSHQTTNKSIQPIN